MFVSRSTMLAILALPAGAIGFVLASAILSRLAIPVGIRDLLYLFVPVFVAGLCMVPFLRPKFDRMAKRDLAAPRELIGTHKGYEWDATGSHGATVMLESLKATKGATDQSSLLLVADFFGVPPTGEVMQHLTGAGSSVLHRVKNGGHLGSADDRAHLEVLAAFVRDVDGYLTQSMGSSTSEAPEMERWLAAGRLEVGTRTYRPIDALADRELAIGALNTLRTSLD